MRDALIETAKHTASAKVQFGLRVKVNLILINVIDEGRGFPFKGYYDLSTMCAMQAGPDTIKQRVQNLGGTLLLDTNDSGTCLVVEIPLKNKEG